METVERALGDLRVGSAVGAGRGGGRRGHGRHGEAKDIKVPTMDFDFQGSSATFDKSAAAPRKNPKDAGEEETGPSDETKDKAYNPRRAPFLIPCRRPRMARLPHEEAVVEEVAADEAVAGLPGGRNRREERERAECCYFRGTWWCWTNGPWGVRRRLGRVWHESYETEKGWSTCSEWTLVDTFFSWRETASNLNKFDS